MAHFLRSLHYISVTLELRIANDSASIGVMPFRWLMFCQRGPVLGPAPPTIFNAAVGPLRFSLFTASPITRADAT
jgi:hypothetical protein